MLVPPPQQMIHPVLRQVRGPITFLNPFPAHPLPSSPLPPGSDLSAAAVHAGLAQPPALCPPLSHHARHRAACCAPSNYALCIPISYISNFVEIQFDTKGSKHPPGPFAHFMIPFSPLLNPPAAFLRLSPFASHRPPCVAFFQIPPFVQCVDSHRRRDFCPQPQQLCNTPGASRRAGTPRHDHPPLSMGKIPPGPVMLFRQRTSGCGVCAAGNGSSSPSSTGPTQRRCQVPPEEWAAARGGGGGNEVGACEPPPPPTKLGTVHRHPATHNLPTSCNPKSTERPPPHIFLPTPTFRIQTDH